MLEGIVERFLPCHVPDPWSTIGKPLGTGAGNKKRVTDEALIGIVKFSSVEKAPGPDEF